jgi:hypothetical protein
VIFPATVHLLQQILPRAALQCRKHALFYVLDDRVGMSFVQLLGPVVRRALGAVWGSGERAVGSGGR